MKNMLFGILVLFACKFSPTKKTNTPLDLIGLSIHDVQFKNVLTTLSPPIVEIDNREALKTYNFLQEGLAIYSFTDTIRAVAFYGNSNLTIWDFKKYHQKLPFGLNFSTTIEAISERMKAPLRKTGIVMPKMDSINTVNCSSYEIDYSNNKQEYNFNKMYIIICKPLISDTANNYISLYYFLKLTE